jgi:mono/diheme cytochrome c family protein
MLSKTRYLFHALLVAAVVGLGLYVAGCEYNVTTNPAALSLHVTVTPVRWTMETSSSLELAAKVTGFKSDSTVTWSFLGKTLGDLQPGGNAAIYVSPDSISGASDTVIVQAVSNEDASKHAICTIVIMPASTNPAPTITLSPLSATVEIGASQQFVATVVNAVDTSVTWSLVGQGTLSQTGLYIAPSSISGSSATATVKVTLNSDTTIWTAADVTITAPCYWTAAQQILGSFCTQVGTGQGCHNATQRAEGYDLTLSRDILRMARSREGSQSKLMSVITRSGGEEAMPPVGYPKLSADQIASIKKWIDSGMDTTACTPNTGGCDTTNVKYSTFIRATFQNACLGCHSGANPTGTYDLSTYNGVVTMAHSGQLVGSISHQAPYRAMPDGGMMLDDCTIAKIRAWVEQGAPNN